MTESTTKKRGRERARKRERESEREKCTVKGESPPWERG